MRLFADEVYPNDGGYSLRRPQVNVEGIDMAAKRQGSSGRKKALRKGGQRKDGPSQARAPGSGTK